MGYTRSGDHDYFVRQLYDMKGSADLETIPAVYLVRYAALCGAVLARAHARTGDPAQIAGYLGKSDAFDKALVEFAFRYADQNDADYAAFKQAVAEGGLEARAEESQIKVLRRHAQEDCTGQGTRPTANRKKRREIASWHKQLPPLWNVLMQGARTAACLPVTAHSRHKP